mgnify:CR=1 FL=1
MKKIRSFLSSCGSYVIALILAVIIASVLILVQGSNPVEAFSWMIKGALGSKSAIASSIRWSTPVIIASTAAVIAQKSGINNLGIEGQLYFGALTSAICAVYVQGPAILVILVSILTGALAGMLYAVVPAVLKLYFSIDEMITTLMLNYAAIQFTEYITMLLMGFDSNTNPDLIATAEIPEGIGLFRFMEPYQADIGFFIGILMAVLIFLVYRYTRVGYEWKLIGQNPDFAKYGGIKHIKNYMMIFLLSGAVAGVCGAMEMLGPHRRFRSEFSTNMGWDGIMVALIAKNNPIAAIFVSIIWGMIKAGSMNMERMTSVNRVLVTLVQALFVLFITVDFKTLMKKIVKSRKGEQINV